MTPKPIRISLQFARASMRLARPIVDREGRLVAGTGTALEPRVLRVLRTMALQTVLVFDGTGIASWETVRPLAAEVAEVAARFRALPPSSPLAQLEAAIVRHLEHRATRLSAEAEGAAGEGGLKQPA